MPCSAAPSSASCSDMHHIRASLLASDEIVSDHFLLRFAAPEVAAVAQPGQWVHVRTSDTLDPLLRRPLSIADVAEDGESFLILCRVVGRGTEELAQRRPGEAVDIIGPIGRGFDLGSVTGEGEASIALVAGGYGVAPLHFLLRRLRTRAEAAVRAVVFIGAESANKLLFLDRLTDLADEVHTTTVDGSAGHEGLVTQPFEAAVSESPPDVVFSCGPTAMMAAVAGVCSKHDVPCQVSLEQHMGCGVGVCLGCAVPIREGGEVVYRRACSDGPVFPAESVEWEGLQ
jgi:dihydroorotate dehydrogenase electron transfer subunit